MLRLLPILTALVLASCSNSKKVVSDLSEAVEAYCLCVDRVIELPTTQLAASELLVLEKKECGTELTQINTTQEEITVPGDEAIRTIRTRQQACYHKLRETHNAATSNSLTPDSESSVVEQQK